MSGLVYIGKVLDIMPIPNADFIESLTVVLGEGGKWRGTARKGDFAVGSQCQVYLQDSTLPDVPEFEFMRRYSHRVRMARLRGVPSEVLIMPQTIPGSIGMDITEAAGVTKYEKPMSAGWHLGETYGTFPHFIPITDELNFQKVPHVIEALYSKPYYITEKVDGMSVTAYKFDGHFGVCSRRLEKKDTSADPLWQLARKYNFDNATSDGFAIQMEVAGPGIQSNPLGLKELTPFVFDIYDIREQQYLGFESLRRHHKLYDLPIVTVLEEGYSWTAKTDDELRKMAEGKYPNGKQREGIVIRTQDYQTVLRDRMSFKIINLLYKD